jgi:hypothetical protein
MIYLTYRNIETGETREYLSPDYPWSDSVWMATWEFVDQRIDDSELSMLQELQLIDMYGDNVTDYYIQNPDYQFILISNDLGKSNRESFGEANRLYLAASSFGYSFIVLTGSLEDEIEALRAEQGLDRDLEFVNADDTDLKTIIRANPGLVLIKDGVVIDKWHYHDLPGDDYIEQLEEH